jgi:protein tyrosine phosphatase
LAFPDGEHPPDDVVERWLALIDSEFGPPSGKGTTAEGDEAKSTGNVIAVHCVAGLGR